MAGLPRPRRLVAEGLGSLPPHRLSKNSRINATQVRLAALESLPLGINNPSGPIPLEIMRLAALAYDQ